MYAFGLMGSPVLTYHMPVIFLIHKIYKEVGSRVGGGDGWGLGEWRWVNGDNCTGTTK